MPAIDLTRLRIKIAELMEYFDQPTIFLRKLHEIFDFYADRTLRPGQNASPVTVLPTYRVPTPILRQIEMELTPQVYERVEESLTLADALWDERYLEMRLLSVHILGRVPPRAKNLNERLTDWVAETREPTLRSALLARTLERLRIEAPGRFIRLVSNWMSPARPKMWSNGIRALIPLLKDPDFENLPPIYEMVKPVIEAAPPLMQKELIELIAALYNASPVETSFFLRQTITLSTNPQTRITFRRVLPYLPEPLADNLREQLRQAKI